MARVYIMGPMTGREHYNVAAFEEAAERWRAAGWVVTTPFDTNAAVWYRHYDRPFDPYNDVCDYGHPLLAEMVAANLQTVTLADAVAVLDGWEKSKGSGIEARLAVLMGKRFYRASSMGMMETPKLALSAADDVPAVTSHDSILHEAYALAGHGGERNDSYDHPYPNFSKIAKGWEVLFGVPITPRLVALAMIWMKTVRDAHKGKRDNIVDISGYAYCIERLDEWVHVNSEPS